MATRIKLYSDYGSYPIWDLDEGGDFDPADLTLSKETIKRLGVWQATYDATLDWNDPGKDTPWSEEDRKAFEQEGIRLWKQLQQELGSEYEVFYEMYLNNKRRLLRHPDELEKYQVA